MALRRARSDDSLYVLAGAIVVGMAAAGGVSAAVTWLLSQRGSSRNSTTDPVLEIFRSAPIDDEPVSAEQEARIAAAQEAVVRGEVDHLVDCRANHARVAG